MHTMKKILIALVCLLGCTKEHPSVVIRTDTPPPNITDPLQYESRVYFETADIEHATVKGYYCFEDRATGEQYDCTDYYLIYTRRYWGLYWEQIYVGATVAPYVIQAPLLLRAQTAVHTRGYAIGYFCDSPCYHPVREYRWIFGIE